MASNLSSIGFAFTDEMVFRETMTSLANAARDRLKCDAGEYAIWRSRTGAEVWFQLDETTGADGDTPTIIGLTPFFEGTTSVVLKVTDALNRPDDTALEGLFRAEVIGVDPDRADAEAAETVYPLVFDAIDFAAHADRPLPALWRCRLTGFCRELDAFATAEDLMRLGEVAIAEKAVIPIGLFGGDDEMEDAGPQPFVLLTGRVLSHRRLTNEVTGAEFHALSVATLEATIDLVADPEIVNGEIAEGAIVQATAWVFGRILD